MLEAKKVYRTPAVLVFRLPANAVASLKRYAHAYKYHSQAELLSLILTEAAYTFPRSWQGFIFRLKWVGRIKDAHEVVGCRVPTAVAEIIKTQHAPEINDTPSVWCARVVLLWLAETNQEADRRQKLDLYGYWAGEQGKAHKTLCRTRCLPVIEAWLEKH